MTTCERGDVVLVKFPFTSYKEGKKRPAVIVSVNAYNQAGDDVIATAITGNLKAARRPGDYLLSRWQEAGLLKESLVKSVIFTIEKSLIARKIGKVNEVDMKGISKGLMEALGLKAGSQSSLC